MTSEEIRAAIDRLKVDDPTSVYGTASAFIDIVGPCSAIAFRNRLIELLEQADPDTHMELPKDANGVPIHVGDEMDGIEGEGETGIVTSVLSDGIVLNNHAYAYNPKAFKHYKPTVEEILGELESLHDTGGYSYVVTRAAELAGKLRELMQDE